MSVVWEHFEKISNNPGSAICLFCRKSYSYKTTTSNLKKHLTNRHGIAFKGFNNAKRPNADTDTDSGTSEQPEAGDIFSDATYLEEKPPKPPRKRKRFSYLKEEMNASSERQEIPPFLNYISALLKNVDDKLMPQLQADIIGLIVSRGHTS